MRYQFAKQCDPTVTLQGLLPHKRHSQSDTIEHSGNPGASEAFHVTPAFQKYCCSYKCFLHSNCPPKTIKGQAAFRFIGICLFIFHIQYQFGTLIQPHMVTAVSMLRMRILGHGLHYYFSVNCY